MPVDKAQNGGGSAMGPGDTALVTGAHGLVGSAVVRRLARTGLQVIGIDNDARAQFFGAAASTRAEGAALCRDIPTYRTLDIDLRDTRALSRLFQERGQGFAIIVHAAAQPSHDWSALDPVQDFAINAVATLDLLEQVRNHAPSAHFVLLSSNKVYGDRPNELPLDRQGQRLVLPTDHPYAASGIDEGMSIDQCRHSVFGVSKTAADLLTQEYALRFGLDATVFRAGCLTGVAHRGTALHGFLNHLVRTVLAGDTYRVCGYGGYQVRDNLLAEDVAEAVWLAAGRPGLGVYNLGGGPAASVSVLEALDMAGELSGRAARLEIDPKARYGDHKWWISDTGRFRAAFPQWTPSRNARELIAELVDGLCTP
ncbi:MULTISPECIES: NAD-dependent epimerase/dehydratase family protein [unclassified Meridianimarinicoccus]|uniref:NAD-dependent epimerase/dehydratase family protein n=1 Tax=unclassified Meridianimarinicoccus TaxID=2923344 RepID=UPI0018669067|nr:NAD-dependent epimerase/dehydratase family protein [Fluviibacterium sp. MJW13]